MSNLIWLSEAQMRRISIWSILRWSDLEDAAVKASATSFSPKSIRRLPRRDWT
jgi:hypothetical protein